MQILKKNVLKFERRRRFYVYNNIRFVVFLSLLFVVRRLFRETALSFACLLPVAIAAQLIGNRIESD